MQARHSCYITHCCLLHTAPLLLPLAYWSISGMEGRGSVVGAPKSLRLRIWTWFRGGGGGGGGNRSKQERGTKADWCQNNDEQNYMPSQSSKTTVVKTKSRAF